MPPKCRRCGQIMDWPPNCYGAPAPWREMGITDAEFAARVELTADQCVIDRKHFFIRGHIEIPIHGSSEGLAFSVWCSLSEKSFRHMTDRWCDPGRVQDPPYFGWLQTLVPGYGETVPTKTMVHSRGVGVVPSVEVDHDHALGREQRAGITRERWEELARIVMGDGPAVCNRCYVR